MVENIATLGIRVKFDQVDKAGKSLNRLDRSSKKAEKSTQSLGRGIRRAAGIFGLLATAIAGVGFTALIINAGRTARELANLSRRLGIATQDIQTLSFAAEQTGITQQTLAIALQRVQRRVGEAAQGFGEARDAILELGLVAKDLSELPIDEQFRQIAGAFENVTSNADRTRLAFKLFDSEGVALLQTINAGRAGLEAFEQRARDLGLTLSNEQVKALETVSLKFIEFRTIIGSTADTIASDLSIELLALSDQMSGVSVEAVNDLSKSFAQFIGFIVVVAQSAISRVVAGFKAIGETAVFLVITLASLGEVFVGFGNAGEVLLEANKNFLIFKDRLAAVAIAAGGTLDERLEKLAERIQRINETIAEGVKLDAANAARGGGGGGGLVNPRAEREASAERIRQFEKQAQAIEKELALIEANSQAVSAFNSQIARQIEERTRLNNAIEIGIEALREEEIRIAAENTVRMQGIEISKEEIDIIVERLILLEKERVVFEKRAEAARKEADAETERNRSVRERLEPFFKELGDLNAQLAEAIKSGFKRAEDALLEFVTTGKLNFRDFANSIIRDLIRIAIRRAIAGIFSAGAGGGGGTSFFGQGGVVQSPVGFQQGGLIRSPTGFTFAGGRRGIAGERGAEAILPLARTPGGNLGVIAQGGGTSTVININVEGGSRGNRQADNELAAEIARTVDRTLDNKIITTIRRQQRPGRLLNRQGAI